MLHTLVYSYFCPNYACQANRTYVTIIVNHLELFSTIFGAKFVFELLTKFAFENIIEKGQKTSLFSFYFPIQNMLGSLSWSLNESCRELNSK
jgi:hypothetical protein